MAELMGFIVALANVSQPLQQFIGVTGQLQQGIAAAQNLFELLDEPREPQTGGIGVTAGARRCAVRPGLASLRARQGCGAEWADA